jgi:hypothetical protein
MSMRKKSCLEKYVVLKINVYYYDVSFGIWYFYSAFEYDAKYL